MVLQRDGFPEVFFRDVLSKKGFLSGSGVSNPGTGYFRFFSPEYLAGPAFKFVFLFRPVFFFFVFLVYFRKEGLLILKNMGGISHK